jgi:hypothetical protein
MRRVASSPASRFATVGRLSLGIAVACSPCTLSAIRLGARGRVGSQKIPSALSISLVPVLLGAGAAVSGSLDRHQGG